MGMHLGVFGVPPLHSHTHFIHLKVHLTHDLPWLHVQLISLVLTQPWSETQSWYHDIVSFQKCEMFEINKTSFIIAL